MKQLPVYFFKKKYLNNNQRFRAKRKSAFALPCAGGLVVPLLFCALFLLPASLSARTEVKIYTKGSRAGLEKIRSLLNYTDKIVEFALPPNKAIPLDYEIVLLAPEEFKKKNIIDIGKERIRLYLPESSGKQFSDQKFLSRMLGAVLCKKSGRTIESGAKVPDWIKKAFIAKLLRKNTGTTVPGMAIYPGVHSLIMSGEKIKWLNAIEHPVPVNAEGAYKIYLETSEIILNSIIRMRGGRQILQDILTLSDRGIPQIKLFRTVIVKKLRENRLVHGEGKTPDELLQQWLGDSFTKASVNVLNPCNATFAEKLFKKAAIVTYTAKAERTETGHPEKRSCTLDELAYKIDEITNLRRIILSKQRELVGIAFSMPAELQKPLYAISNILPLAASGQKQNFKKRYKIEKQKFFDLLDRLYQVERFLRNAESKFVPPGYTYAAELKILRKMDDVKKKRWPAVYSFMEKYEKGN